MKPRDADLKKEFEAIDTENNKNLDFPEFLSLYDTLAFRPEIQVIFKEHATGSETTLMTMDDFRRFLVSEQGVSTFSLDSIPVPFLTLALLSLSPLSVALRDSRVHVAGICDKVRGQQGRQRSLPGRVCILPR